MTTLPEHQSVDDCRRSLLLPRLKQLLTLRREGYSRIYHFRFTTVYYLFFFYFLSSVVKIVSYFIRFVKLCVSRQFSSKSVHVPLVCMIRYVRKYLSSWRSAISLLCSVSCSSMCRCVNVICISSLTVVVNQTAVECWKFVWSQCDLS